MPLPSGTERRMSKRIPMSVGLRVYAYGMLVATGMTVDMSEHGLCMRIEEEFSEDEFAPGKHLDVMLDESPANQWLPIRVVRQWQDGVAASFIGLETGGCPA